MNVKGREGKVCAYYWLRCILTCRSLQSKLFWFYLLSLTVLGWITLGWENTLLLILYVNPVFVSPIITHKLLDRFASNLKWGIPTLVLRRVVCTFWPIPPCLSFPLFLPFSVELFLDLLGNLHAKIWSLSLFFFSQVKVPKHFYETSRYLSFLLNSWYVNFIMKVL